VGVRGGVGESDGEVLFIQDRNARQLSCGNTHTVFLTSCTTTPTHLSQLIEQLVLLQTRVFLPVAVWCRKQEIQGGSKRKKRKQRRRATTAHADRIAAGTAAGPRYIKRTSKTTTLLTWLLDVRVYAGSKPRTKKRPRPAASSVDHDRAASTAICKSWML